MLSLVHTWILNQALRIFILVIGGVIGLIFFPVIIAVYLSFQPPIKTVCDEKWVTQRSLCNMRMDLYDYYELGDPKARRDFHSMVDSWTREANNSIQKVQSVEELWALVLEDNYKKDPFFIMERYIKDGWDVPLKLEIKKEKKSLVIRITSSGPNRIFEFGLEDDLYLEMTVLGNKLQDKLSWEHFHEN